ncbi:hypothetical protein P3339_22410 [Microbulbifer sp. MLAF003]|uniref:hypothetical protein n=1 Tax=Microbulbifer sp. MLAF003 TaxID=3032582 RepID=UPI0024AD2EE4|nr:hypothetical protein [Microbulbifer sp. MLAF003]WHI51116.1 hypothetical protein P3339_22410 [Microbulbifer sp. MLAF003]
MIERFIHWTEFTVVVLPSTAIILFATLLFPFGILLRPEFIIPAYIGGILGVYSLWRMFLFLEFRVSLILTKCTYYYLSGALSIACLFLVGEISDRQLFKPVTTPWILPILVGAHWIFKISKGTLGDKQLASAE